MDVEPEIILEDGEISSDEEVDHTISGRTAGFSNTYSRRDPGIKLEHGEINDVEVDYTPLERPHNFTNTYKPPEKNSDNESELSSVSESDSDDWAAKKPKVKIKSKKLNKPSIKRKKYDIWSSHVQEDVLAETLVSCDVSKIDRSRDVESYQHFDLRNKITGRKQIGRRQGNKRRHGQRNNRNISSRRKDDSDEEDIKGSERVILDLVTNIENTEEEVAKDIANKLCEEKDDLIRRIVQIAGKKKSIEIFNDTKRIELDGGMLIMNGVRRRTPGGVFIFLLKRDDDITREQQAEIFIEERQQQVRVRKAEQKAKLKAIKEQIAKKSTNDKLPLLLSRNDLEVQKASALRDRNESESEECVNNPPPSPVTDGKENSNDGMNIPSYFVDSENVDMDVF